MIMHDWNNEKEDVILLIHPMLSSANGMKTFIADIIGEEYRYLAPDLSAHGDADKDTYKSAADEAKQIHEYLAEKKYHGALSRIRSFTGWGGSSTASQI